jgi:hypothetical protein
MDEMDTYGTIVEFPTEKAVLAIKKMLADNGIKSIVIYRISSAGPVYGIAVALKNVERAKKLVDEVLGNSSMQFEFYDWNR